MTQEFELIRQLVDAQVYKRGEVVLGIGDDAALLSVPAHSELVVTTDTLNSGVHFPVDTAPEDIGHKTLAVGLSDLAAMGAEPLAVNLSLSLPEGDAGWVERFAEGFLKLADEFNVQLVGGDTTRGPLSISATVFGTVPRGRAIRRTGAQAGDLICVTGSLGDAGAALLALQGELKLTGPQESALLNRLDRPEPRVAVGQALRGLATSCIDISDGLTADLGHLLEPGKLGAMIYVDQLPISDTLQQCFDNAGGWGLALKSGDDYELCFTIPEERQSELEDIRKHCRTHITYIGIVERQQGIHLMWPDGAVESIDAKGYEHFSGG